MKKWTLSVMLAFSAVFATAQKQDDNNPHTLLWQISGNGLQQPSYLFGTIHMLCSDDAVLSDSLKHIISRCKEVYLEVDMDNLFEMLGMMKHMKMRDDTTLADLLSKEDFEKVKSYFDNKGGLIPFSMLETFKPMLSMSTLEEADIPCESAVAMEQLIMEEAKRDNKPIKGLETMAYQASIFDSIPYKLQAEQLVAYIDSAAAGNDHSSQEFAKLLAAYKNQDLEQLQALINKDDDGMAQYSNLLLYNRNRNWVEKLKNLMPGKSLLVAVGAGHLPGDKGVISLLRKAGYKVTPVNNDMHKKMDIQSI
jgi:uncharacterized protein YbaP (TraB family)